jgi:transcriptional regulator with XRE-family HTH domain
MPPAPKTVKSRRLPAMQKPRRVSPQTRMVISRLRRDFGLTRKTLARMTGLSERTLATWEAGGALNDTGRRAIVSVERLLRNLTKIIRREAIAEWMEQPNEGLGALKPLEVVERGESDRLWRMIYFVGSGTAS